MEFTEISLEVMADMIGGMDDLVVNDLAGLNVVTGISAGAAGKSNRVVIIQGAQDGAILGLMPLDGDSQH